MRTNIFRMSILPLILLVSFAFQPQGNDRGNKGNSEKTRGNQHDSKEGNRNAGNEKNDRGNAGNDNQSNNGPGNRGNKDHKRNGNSGNGRSGKQGNNGPLKDNNGSGHGGDKDKGKWRREVVKWDWDDNIQWGFDNYPNRKRPKDLKKVTICHNTGDNNYPVTISVSENAMKAHLNHGDQMGNCGNGYSDRWPGNYIKTRENVYNAYENTRETMSYSEALIRYAAEKLFGIKSTFQSQRATLSPDEIQRREVVIMELQNNINSLENQLRSTRQRTDGVNINIML